MLSNSSDQPDMLFSDKTKHLRIDIANRDDNPLTIASVKAYQRKQFAVAYLEKGEKYYLVAGDSSAQEVSYDLSFLQAKPLSAMHVINHSQIENNPAYAKPVFKAGRDYTKLIWLSIAVVLILLSLLTWRMVKELNAKNTGNTNT
jgi:Na+-translocating ferredoxin:NAD+ oxidoreductase RnfD subunit